MDKDNHKPFSKRVDYCKSYIAIIIISVHVYVSVLRIIGTVGEDVDTLALLGNEGLSSRTANIKRASTTVCGWLSSSIN